jgi:hypothetical protein
MKIKVSPKQGLKVRDPISKQHIGEGHEVDECDPYWARKIRFREVAIDKAPVVLADQASDSSESKGEE